MHISQVGSAILLFGWSLHAQGVVDRVPVTVGCRALRDSTVAALKPGVSTGTAAEVASRLVERSDATCAGLILSTLSGNLAVSGAYESAERFAERSIGLLEETHAPQDHVLFWPLQLLTTTRGEQGKLALARKAFERLRAIRTERPEDEAAVHGIAGFLLQSEGRWRGAEDEYLAAIRSWEAAGLGKEPETASVLVSLATLYMRTRRVPDAAQALTDAETIFDGSGHSVPVDRLRLLGVWGAVHYLARDFRRAEQDYREAIAIADREPSTDAAIRLALLDDYAKALRKTGRRAEAGPVEARAAALRREVTIENVVDVTQLSAPQGKNRSKKKPNSGSSLAPRK